MASCEFRLGSKIVTQGEDGRQITDFRTPYVNGRLVGNCALKNQLDFESWACEFPDASTEDCSFAQLGKGNIRIEGLQKVKAVGTPPTTQITVWQGNPGENIGEGIKQARSGLSQVELGQRVGITGRHLSDIEHGRKLPRLSTLLGFARALGVDIIIKPTKKTKKKSPTS